MQIELSKEQLQYLKSLDSKKKKRKFLLDCFIKEIEAEPKSFSELIDELLSTDVILKINRQAMGDFGGIEKTEDVLGNKYYFKPWDLLKDPDNFKSECEYQIGVLYKGKFYKTIQEAIESQKEQQQLSDSCVKISGLPITKPNYSQEEIDLVTHNIEQRKLSEQGSELLKFDMLTRQHQLPFLTEFQREGILRWMNDWEQLKDTAIPIRFSEDCRNTIDRTDLMIEENNFLSWMFNRLVLLGENHHLYYIIKLKETVVKFNKNAN